MLFCYFCSRKPVPARRRRGANTAQVPRLSFSRLQKRRHLLHTGGHVQALGTVGGTCAAADAGGGTLVLRQGTQPGQTPGGQVLFSPSLVLVEGGKQEGNVQLPGTVGAAVAAARTGHRIESVEHVADLPHQGDLLLRQKLVV